jgi:hypothetical protein
MIKQKAKHLSLILFSFTQLVTAQTEQKMRELFYGLPVDSSRKVICQRLKSDKRFKEKTFNPSTDSYLGLCNDMGLIKSKPDSILIRITYGQGVNHEDNSLIKTTIIKSYYYFTSAETAQAEYSKLTAFLKPLAKDSTSDSFADEDAAGEGIYYNFSQKQSKINEIDVYIATCSSGNFGLFISYTRSDE